MIIGIDASFLRKPGPGLGQVTTNFIKKLAALSNGQQPEFVLYLEEDTEFELPTNFRKEIFLPALWKRDDIFRAIWWQKFLLPKIAKKDKCDVLISLYQCATVAPQGNGAYHGCA